MTVTFTDRVQFDVHVPVVVIGAGAAGLVAALAVRAAGVAVLVLERDPLPRGSTALSAGLIPAAGTRWQHASGIVDDPARFAADIMAKAHGEPDPALVDALTQRAAPVLEWLADAHGLTFSLVQDFTYPGHSAQRMHGLPSRSGAALMDALRQAAEQSGADILCDAHATELVCDAAGDRVLGVEYARPDGATERVGCDALVLACSGYGGDRDLVAQHIPSLAGAPYFGHPSNTGHAIRWGQAMGAQLRDLSGHQGHGSVAHPASILITWATITEGGFQVNAAGVRFANEMRGYSEQAADVLRQPDGVAWTVFDDRIAAIARQFEDFRQAEAAGCIVCAPDMGALAAAIGVSASVLTATAADVETMKRGVGADSLGRCFAGNPALRGPYCAVRVTGALFHTQGGLAVDPGAAVLRKDGRAFANLFAAGGAACGISGREASGYLSGNGLLSAVVLGAVAGRSSTAAVLRGGPGPEVRVW